MPGPDTVEFDVMVHSAQRTVARVRHRRWRGLTGALAAGLAVLAVAVLVAQCVSWARSTEGPGIAVVLGHVTGAVLALGAQCGADRARGAAAAVAGAVVVATATAVLWFFWWD